MMRYLIPVICLTCCRKQVRVKRVWLMTVDSCRLDSSEQEHATGCRRPQVDPRTEAAYPDSLFEIHTSPPPVSHRNTVHISKKIKQRKEKWFCHSQAFQVNIAAMAAMISRKLLTVCKILENKRNLVSSARCLEFPEGARVIQKYEEMMQLLDRCVTIVTRRIALCVVRLCCMCCCTKEQNGGLSRETRKLERHSSDMPSSSSFVQVIVDLSGWRFILLSKRFIKKETPQFLPCCFNWNTTLVLH